MSRAIVVGSGLAGLTAAYRLKKAGWQVTVLEREDHLGGRTTTYRKNGYLVDGGATAISSSYVEYVGLLKEVGLYKDVVDTSCIFGIYRNGAVHEVDSLRPVRSFLTAKWMSWSEKLRFVLGALKLLKYMKGVTVADPAGSVKYDHRSIGDILRECFSDEMCKSLLDPLMGALTFGDFKTTTCVELFTGLVAASGRYINILGGIDRLPQALAVQVDLQLNADVQGIARRDELIDVTFVDQAGVTRTLTGDACVLTCPFPAAVRMYPPLGEEAPLLAQQSTAAAGFVVHLGYSAPTHTRPAVIATPRSEFPKYASLFIDHNKAPDRAPKGHSLFTIIYTPDATTAMKDWTEDALIADSCSFVECLFPEVKGHLDMSNLKYWPHISHLAPTGYFKAIQQFHSNHSKADRLQLAGDYFSLPGQETAVGWGNRAAKQLMAHFRS